MNKQRIDGALKQASGKLKSIAGKLTGDAKLTAEGLVEQVEGKHQLGLRAKRGF
eukprot:gene22055-28086_t